VEAESKVKRKRSPLPKKKALTSKAKKIIERSIVGDSAVLKYYNDGPHKTPVTWALDARWADLRLRDRWPPEKLLRLCEYAKIDTWELASILNFDHRRMGNLLSNNRRPELLGPEATVITNYAYVTLGYDQLIQLVGHIPLEFFK